MPRPSEAGKVVHTIGWPMDDRTYGGSWMYHMATTRSRSAS